MVGAYVAELEILKQKYWGADLELPAAMQEMREEHRQQCANSDSCLAAMVHRLLDVNLPMIEREMWEEE